MNNDKVKKCISNEEKEIIECIESLKLNSIVIPYKIKGNTLIMEKGIVSARLNLNILKLYDECLKQLYEYKNTEYSEGLYAFYNSDTKNSNKEDFIIYLKEELLNIENEYKEELLDEFKVTYNECKDKFLKEYNLIYESNNFKSEICLLHGDLFSGNILEYNKKYKLIDFEYMRFGIKEMELTFLLFWDFITNESITKYAKTITQKDIDNLNKAGYVNEQQINYILNLFLPMFLMLACLYVSAGKYKDKDEIKRSIHSFYKEYYKNDVEEKKC